MRMAASGPSYFRLTESIEEQENRRQLLASDISGKENRLTQIKPLLNNIRETAKPLFDILGLLI